MLNRRTKLVAFALSVLSLLVLRYVIDSRTDTLPQTLHLVTYAALPIAGGLTTLSFCSLLRTLLDKRTLAASPLIGRMSEDQTSHFFVGFVVVAYFSLVRPPIATYVLFLPYVEWAAIALAVYAMKTAASPSTSEFHSDSEGPDWKEHVQKIRRETGPDFVHIASVMEQFVENGVKEPLLVCLALHLQRLGETEEGILKTLGPLVDYHASAQRGKSYFSVFPWAKRRLTLQNEKTREDLLKILLEKIDGLRSE